MNHEEREILLRNLVVNCQKISKDLPAIEQIIQANELIGLAASELEGIPSEHQIGDKVHLYWFPDFEEDHRESFPALPAQVLSVHFYPGKVKYDLDILFVAGKRSRIYNVDSDLVQARMKEKVASNENENRLKRLVKTIKEANPYNDLGNFSYYAQWNEHVAALESLITS